MLNTVNVEFYEGKENKHNVIREDKYTVDEWMYLLYNLKRLINSTLKVFQARRKEF